MYSTLIFALSLLVHLTLARPAAVPQKAISKYPACRKGHGTGYAHYDGWRLLGDDLSGAVPVSPESACVNACNKYGAACSGIFFDASISRCFLKAVHPAVWTFTPGEEGDATDLIGGCEMWSGVVNAEMDKICCVD